MATPYMRSAYGRCWWGDAVDELRPYQSRVVDLVCTHRGGVVRAPTGAGKSLIGLRSAAKLGYSRLLVVVPRYSALLAWERALERDGLLGDAVFVEKWSRKKRATLWSMPQSDRAERQIIVLLYNTLVKDLALVVAAKWEVDVILWDEAHRIRNRKTTFAKTAKTLSYMRRNVFLTATPKSRGVQDIWTMLNCLDRGKWASYWDFVSRYCVREDNGFAKVIVGARKSTLEELKFRVREYIFNIPDAEVAKHVPKRIRQVLPVAMDKKVERVYRRLEEEGLADLSGRGEDWVVTPSLLTRTLKLEQLLACPRAVHEKLPVGALEDVLEHARDNVEEGLFVVFSVFREPFRVWRRHLESAGCHVEELHGGVSAREQALRIARFENARGAASGLGRMSVLLCTIAFAESFDLLMPRTAYMLGFSWDQIANYQAEGRLTRGVKSWCNFFYVVHKNSIDEAKLHVLNKKVRATEGVLIEA